MSEFDVDAYLDAIEIPTIKINGKRYEARVLSVEEWSPYQIRMNDYFEGLRKLLPEDTDLEKLDKVEKSEVSDLEKLDELNLSYGILRIDYFEALFGHWKSKFKPWTWFRPDLVKELENLPNRDVVFGDFFALRVAASMTSARN